MKQFGIFGTTLALLAIAFVAGCEDSAKNFDDKLVEMGWKKKPEETIVKERKAVIPPDIKGTIAETASLVTGGDAPVGGVGIVVGLVKEGSSEVPPQFRTQLVKYLKEEIHIGSPLSDTESVSPSRFLEDPDTAVVRVDAIIPPGVPKGTKIDVLVSALPRTQTQSLQGGVLLPLNLTWDPSGDITTADLKTLAVAKGTIFINPFLDPAKSEDKIKLRQGRILNGATVSTNMKLRLQLSKPDYHTASLIQRRINYRFNEYGKVAAATSRYSVDIHIPEELLNDYDHFLQLILHLPLRFGEQGYEQHAAWIAREIEKPDINQDGLALIWEAMGRQILTIVQKVYSSKNPGAAFYAIRTGLRMGDAHIAGELMLKIARDSESPFQVQAIKALGENQDVLGVKKALEELLNSPNNLTRIAAYDAIMMNPGQQIVKSCNVDNDFILDVVPTKSDYMIYVTQTGQPRIVLFGEGISVENNVFFETPIGDLTVFSKEGDPISDDKLQQNDHLVIFRKLPDRITISDRFRTNFSLVDTIKILGMPPKLDIVTGKVPGLGLTYSQIVSFLYRMTQQNNIKAKFILQPLPEIRRMYEFIPSIGRPDVDNP